MRFGRGRLRATGMTMEQLAEMGLSRSVGRTVSNRTALPGLFDWTLEWSPELQPVDPDRPAIFTALQEQLGLKLEPARGPVPVLVIARAERPTPN